MKLEDIKLGVSPLTSEIYVGTVSKKDHGLWLQKKPFVSDFCRALMEWNPPGETTIIRDQTGKLYKVSVVEVTEQELQYGIPP